MPTQWSEAEHVPLGCIAPSFAGKSSYTVRVDVGIGPYKVLTPQQKMTGQGPVIFCYSLSKNASSRYARAGVLVVSKKK